MPDDSLSTPLDGTLPIDAPLRVDNPETATWSHTCDVLVVGLGAAGGAATIAARDAGAEVLVAERFEGGGATIKSGGIVYLGGGTRYQREAGYEDTPEAMFNYLRQESGEAVSPETLRRFCDGSLEMLAWLESLGVEFQSNPNPPKTSYPKDGTYLYYSGNEAVPACAKLAKPAPRGHRVKTPGIDSGRELYHALRRKVEQLQIPVLRQAAARRLIVDSSGAVIGAELWQLVPGSAAQREHQALMKRAENWHNFAGGYADKLRVKALKLEQQHARRVTVRARNGVVLSTGGFIFNREMVGQYAPKYLPAMRLGATGCDGSGIRLGQSAGGVPQRMEKGSAWRFINPPTAWPRGIAINRQGQRFCNEQVYGARLGVEMVDNNDGKAWLILDRKLRRQAMREALFGKLWFFQSVPAFFLMLFAPRAATPEQLAAKLKIPGAPLRETLARYNSDIDTQQIDALGKDAGMRQALDEAPYYALNISVDNPTFPCPAITLGGLRVDESSGSALNGNGEPIRGLYAAGRTAVGVASNGYVSGLSLADCLWSGRRAGAHAATIKN